LIVKVSNETPESYVESGFDRDKPVKGRKRPIVANTIGCVLVVRVHAANVFDGKAARQVITNLFPIVTIQDFLPNDRLHT